MAQRTIACTGGIGSGKSCIVGVFAALGYPCYDCDMRAKRLYDEDASLLKDIASIAGKEILSGGKLNKTVFAKKIFSDPVLLQRIEELVHPAVVRDFVEWRSGQESEIVVIESAIYLEKEIMHSLADFVIVATAEEDERVLRIMARDGLSKEAIKNRMAHQWTDAQRREKADCVIQTDDRKPVLPIILDIIEKNRKDGKN